MGSVSFRALEGESPACLASRHSHWFRFYPMLPYLSTFLHPFAPRALPRFFALTGALTPAQGALRTLIRGNEHPPYPSRSPWFTPHDLPCIPSPNTWRALPSLLRCPPSLTGSRVSYPGLDFALNPQARRYARPNRVRYPTDCTFASGCSPPRLTATQLPLATRERASPGEEDFHLLRSRLLPGARTPASAGVTIGGTFYEFIKIGIKYL